MSHKCCMNVFMRSYHGLNMSVSGMIEPQFVRAGSNYLDCMYRSAVKREVVICRKHWRERSS